MNFFSIKHTIIPVITFLLFISCETQTYEVTNNQSNNTNIKDIILHYPPHQDSEILLNSGDQITVSVLVSDTSGNPVAGIKLDFMITGEAGGASLSDSSAVSNEDGLVYMNIIAGHSSAHFYIRVQNELTAPLDFDVTVTDSGTVDLSLAFSYFGIYSQSNFADIETGIVFNTTCENINKNTAELSRSRHLGQLDETVKYTELPIDIPFVFIARIYNDNERVISSVCAKPPDSFMQSGANANMTLVLKDCIYSIPYIWQSEDTAESEDLGYFLAGKLSSWTRIGNCPMGLAELFTDCILSYIEGGDTSTCSPGIPTTESQIIRDLRGITDIKGCRTALNSSGEASLEYKLFNLHPDIASLQNDFNEIRNSSDNLMFNRISVISEWQEVSAGKLNHTLKSVFFPLYGTNSFNLQNTEATVNTDMYSMPSRPEDHSFKINIVNIALKLLWDKSLGRSSVAFDGNDVVAFLKERISEAGNGSYAETIRNEVYNGFTDEQIDNAFLFFQSLLQSPWYRSTADDVSFSDISLTCTDEDMDYTADATPDLSLTLSIDSSAFTN